MPFPNSFKLKTLHLDGSAEDRAVQLRTALTEWLAKIDDIDKHASIIDFYRASQVALIETNTDISDDDRDDYEDAAEENICPGPGYKRQAYILVKEKKTGENQEEITFWYRRRWVRNDTEMSRLVVETLTAEMSETPAMQELETPNKLVTAGPETVINDSRNVGHLAAPASSASAPGSSATAFPIRSPAEK
ncbi:hypothetical protein AYL99_11954 [Fonsecaea erecta]|uniref:Uncharacterized protein n=1 Tax=Fonsecaea erecta TaxID=1367422 RepID=A0A178Z2U3_9EURO|nr:hypothetical protein AYL99_11954 [Fonsecaea erecta]OAP53831.1 hypothetical protein AYL99_11954 [Fonsecaea erecta]